MNDKEKYEGLYEDLMDTFSGRKYHRLVVNAKDSKTEIYVADTEGNLVVKCIGKVDESLAKGYYDIHFGKQGKPRRTRLSCAMEVNE